MKHNGVRLIGCDTTLPLDTKNRCSLLHPIIIMNYMLASPSSLIIQLLSSNTQPSKGCLNKTTTFSIINCWYCHHQNDILNIKSKSKIFIWLVVMILMIKYSNEVSFLDLVTIQIQLNNFKCRRFFETPFTFGVNKTPIYKA